MSIFIVNIQMEKKKLCISLTNWRFLGIEGSSDHYLNLSSNVCRLKNAVWYSHASLCIATLASHSFLFQSSLIKLKPTVGSGMSAGTNLGVVTLHDPSTSPYRHNSSSPEYFLNNKKGNQVSHTKIFLSSQET